MNFFTALTLLLVGLKLTGYIDSSWFLVLSPLLVYPAVLIAAVIQVARSTPEERIRRSLGLD